MTTAASRAALARALRQAPGIKAMVGRYGKPNDVWWEREADAVLAAEPHLRLVSGGHSPYDDEATHDRESSAGTHLYDPMCGFCSAAEIDRLTELVRQYHIDMDELLARGGALAEAARTLLDVMNDGGGATPYSVAWDALDAAADAWKAAKLGLGA